MVRMAVLTTGPLTWLMTEFMAEQMAAQLTEKKTC
jgi:hypothetical protein